MIAQGATRASVIHRWVEQHYQPLWDYAAWSPHELILCMVGMELALCEGIIAVIDDPGCPPAEVERHAVAFADAGMALALPRLARIVAEDSILQSLAKAWCEVRVLHQEVERLLDALPVARAVQRVHARDATETDRKALLRVLRQERLVSYRPAKYDDTDLHQEALAAACDYLDQQEHARAAEAAKHVPQRVEWSPMPGPFPTLDPARWDRPATRSVALIQAFGQLFPLLGGDAERTPQKVHEALREFFRRWEAEKRRADEVPLDDLWNEPATDDGPEKVAAATLRRTRVEKVAAELGESARVFLEARLGGKSVAAAAVEAGVSRPTAYKYLLRFKTVAGN